MEITLASVITIKQRTEVGAPTWQHNIVDDDGPLSKGGCCQTARNTSPDSGASLKSQLGLTNNKLFVIARYSSPQESRKIFGLIPQIHLS
jgi:hypothetical protein